MAAAPTATPTTPASLPPASLPPASRLGEATRAAASDVFYNSWRLVPANLIWGGGLVALYLVAITVPLAALLLSPLLGLPTVGIFRIAAKLARGEPVAFSDGLDAWRERLVPAVVASAAVVAAVIVFVSNILAGLASGSVAGWGFATLAAWGAFVTGVLALCYWPLLVDPRREPRNGRAAFRLAAYLVLAHGFRLAGLGLVVAIFLAISTVALPALLMISVAFAALVTCRYVLPAADRLESSLALRGQRFGAFRDVEQDRD